MGSTRENQRLEHLERALQKLSEIQHIDVSSAALIVLEGYVQRFEYTFELAWKFLKDVMESDGLTLEIISPKSVIRQAFESGYLTKAEMWMSMANDRNKMSHTYDFEHFHSVIQKVKEDYYPELESVIAELKKR